MSDCQDRSKQTGKEASTLIIPAKDKFIYLPLKDMEEAGGTIYVPEGAVAIVHSHGKDSKGKYDDENFSKKDKKASDDSGVPNYVITPKEKRKRYDPDKRKRGGGPVFEWNPKNKKWEKEVKKNEDPGIGG